MQHSRLDWGLLLLRIGFGGIMAFVHGLPKLNKLISGDFAFADPLGLGAAFSLVLVVLAEFVCGLLIAGGLLTRLATIPLIVTMLVAAFITHGDDPWQKKEMAVLYLIAYLALALTGPGRLSLDALRNRS